VVLIAKFKVIGQIYEHYQKKTTDNVPMVVFSLLLVVFDGY
jgi:uncharacterized protein with PQ loop repeat